MTFDIVLSVNIRTTSDRLYEALTTAKGVAGWWTPTVKVEPMVGAINEFYFDGLVTKFRVDELEDGKRVVWSIVQDLPGWEDTRIIFDITPDDDTVSLKFSQTGFASQDGGFGVTGYSWAQFIRSIKLLLETGEGEPYGSKGSRLAGTS